MDAKIYIFDFDPLGSLQQFPLVLRGVSVKGIIHIELASTHHISLRPRRVLLCLVATAPSPRGMHASYCFPLSPFLLVEK